MPNITDLSDKELRIDTVNSSAMVGSEYMTKRALEMEWRMADRQLEAARDLVGFTKQLVTATRVLWIATAALFVSSVANRPHSEEVIPFLFVEPSCLTK
jgi:hypothetical protein